MDTDDIFKRHFKFYKRKKPPPDLSNVIDFDKESDKRVCRLRLNSPRLEALAGLHPVEHWDVFSIPNITGFYLIGNPFLPGYQGYWVKRCLVDYPCKPNVTNLDAHMTLTEEDNIWEISQSESLDPKKLIGKLRWTTLGYHHNWDTKHYSLDQHTRFPEDLGYFSCYVVEALAYSSPYQAEAAIINYYHLDSTLAGHTDHSEFDMEAPLVSVSFGQTAIFLLGGLSRAEEPVAMYVRSGDIVVMSGPCRRAYHAVPKILAPYWSLPSCSMQHKKLAAQETTSLAPELEKSEPALQKDYRTESNHVPQSSESIDDAGMMCTDDKISEKRFTCTKYQNNTSALVHCEKNCGREPHNRCSKCEYLDSDSNSEIRINKCSEHGPGIEYESCTCMINSAIKQCVETTDFKPYMDYLRTARINMNVRQVFKPGQSAQDVQLLEGISERKLKAKHI